MFIGIDLGTSSVKIILINSKQKIIASHTEAIGLINIKDGYYEQNPESWYNATLKCFGNIRNTYPKEFSSVVSLAISGQMHGATLIDKDHKVLRNCILWNDTRSKDQCYKLENSYSKLHEETGNIAMPGFTSPKIMWIKENENNIFKKIFKVLLPKDYLRFRLTGDFYTDMSDASGTLWLNVKNRKWSSGLLNATDLSTDHMPKLVEGSEVTSFIKKGLANEIGFANEVLVAGGAGDQAAGAAGTGVIKSTQSFISLGTSGVYFSPSEKFSYNTSQAVHSFCHCIPNTWHNMSVMLSATNCLDWIIKILNLDINIALNLIKKFSNDNIDFLSVPYFLPYLSGERTPHNNPYIRGSFHMLNTLTAKEALLYSVMEGISFGIRDGFEAVEKINPNTEETYIVGGGSKSDIWIDMLTSSLNKSLIVGQDTNMGPSLGAARLAMLSTSNFNMKDVFKKMTIKKETVIDEKLSERLEKRYQIWKDIVIANESISKKLINR